VGSCPINRGIVAFRNFAYIEATRTILALKESEDWLQ
jgi:hypothetical protein